MTAPWEVIEQAKHLAEEYQRRAETLMERDSETRDGWRVTLIDKRDRSGILDEMRRLDALGGRVEFAWEWETSEVEGKRQGVTLVSKLLTMTTGDG